MRTTKVHVIGGDQHGWALDTDLRLALKSLALCSKEIQLVEDPAEAEIIHTVCPEQLIEDPRQKNILESGLPIVAVYSNDPIALFERVPGLHRHSLNWNCIGQSRAAVRQLKEVGMGFAEHVPYIADLAHFKPHDAKLRAALRRKLGLPDDQYIIGSFQRDSLGSNLSLFKPQKGADVFAAIALALQKRIGKENLHVLLAGPRRHWLREKLSNLGIACTFVGKTREKDDFPENILSADQVAQLMSAIDAYVVSSRWEGGPRAILEAAACKTKIISTRVGITTDLLSESCLYGDITEAADLLTKDFHSNALAASVEDHFKRVHEGHSIEAVARRWIPVYQRIALQKPQSSLHAIAQAEPIARLSAKKLDQLFHQALFKAARLKRCLSRTPTITLWGEMVAGPYGGGSQVLKAIANELRRRGYKVLNNAYDDAEAHILNSAFFDVEKAKLIIQSSKKRPPVVHRIDGPISLYRGSDRQADDEVFALNREVATVTAFQSRYSWVESLRMGFKPVNPMIIRNGCDPSFFFKAAPLIQAADPHPPQGRKFKLISTSWSTNQRKGFDTYLYLDDHLDFSRFDYAFIGRSPVRFKNIKMLDPMDSTHLGAELRKADMFIFASQRESASNSLLEAISCGLPVIYYAHSGGNLEFTWQAGLSYEKADEIPALIDVILKDYESYRLCSYAQPISEIVDGYLKTMGLET